MNIEGANSEDTVKALVADCRRAAVGYICTASVIVSMIAAIGWAPGYSPRGHFEQAEESE